MEHWQEGRLLDEETEFDVCKVEQTLASIGIKIEGRKAIIILNKERDDLQYDLKSGAKYVFTELSKLHTTSRYSEENPDVVIYYGFPENPALTAQEDYYTNKVIENWIVAIG